MLPLFGSLDTDKVFLMDIFIDAATAGNISTLTRHYTLGRRMDQAIITETPRLYSFKFSDALFVEIRGAGASGLDVGHGCDWVRGHELIKIMHNSDSRILFRVAG